MKVVINKCYGGFSVSLEALLELVKRGSKAVEVHSAKEWGGEEEWLKYKEGYQKANWLTVIKKGKKVYTVDGFSPESRTDKDLVEVVETMGEKANGSHAELAVVEIPDGTDFEISEYDGIEHIAEKHRTWS